MIDREESNARFRSIREQMRLPIVSAPMFLVSGPTLASACVGSKIACGVPTLNAREPETLDHWLSEFDLDSGLVIPNLIVHRSNPRSQLDLDLVVKYKPKLVISALGHPGQVIESVRPFGGLVFADVNSMELARKAIDAGVDGLVLVCAGAGGHTGSISPFAFIPEVKRIFNGPIIAGGAVNSGAGIRAMELLGADLVNMGTHFISAKESLADQAYREMLVQSNLEDIVATAHFTGVEANYLWPSIEKAGISRESIDRPRDSISFDNKESQAKAWKDIWSAGQGVGGISGIDTVATMVDQLAEEYEACLKNK